MSGFMHQLRRQDGVATLIGVTLTSFLILIITLAVTALMVGELRQAEDAENSVTAYYAAQSGVEDAMQTIKNKLATGDLSSLSQNCSTTGSGGPYDTAVSALNVNRQKITCLSVLSYTDSIESVVGKDQTVQFDLSGADSVGATKISLDWDVDPLGQGSNNFTNPTISGSPAANTPPIMEVTLTNYFPGQPTTVPDPSQSAYLDPAHPATNNFTYTSTLVLLPQCTSAISPGGCPAYSSTPDIPYNTYVQNISTNPYKTQCYIVAPNDRRCRINLTNVTPRAGYRTVVTLRARNAAANFRFAAFDGASMNHPITLPVKNAQVDVTAQVGDSFRRVRTEVPVRTGSFATSVLYGDQSVCKQFNLLDEGGGNYQVQAPYGSCNAGFPLN